MRHDSMPTKESSGDSLTLDEDDLRTIEIVARNGQTGRLTKFEVNELVRVYRHHSSLLRCAEALRDMLNQVKEWNTRASPPIVEECAKVRLTRREAIKIIDRATDRDDPFWERAVAPWYDEAKDDLPTIFDVMAALGVSRQEYEDAIRALSSAPAKETT